MTMHVTMKDGPISYFILENLFIKISFSFPLIVSQFIMLDIQLPRLYSYLLIASMRSIENLGYFSNLIAHFNFIPVVINVNFFSVKDSE
jgi:hypothetical protein